MLRARMRESRSFRRKKNRFVTVLDLFECLEQVKFQRLLLTLALVSELPSYIRTMEWMHFLAAIVSFIYYLYIFSNVSASDVAVVYTVSVQTTNIYESCTYYTTTTNLCLFL